MSNVTLTLKSVCALGLAIASTASAALVYDFNDGTNPFTTPTGAAVGTVTNTRAFGGSGNSLYVAPGQQAVLMIPEEYRGGNVIVTMQVYDRGLYINRALTSPPRPTAVYGPRWGVATGQTFAEGSVLYAAIGATITERSQIESKTRYARTGNGELRFTGSWHSLNDHGSRSASLLGDGGSIVDGAWQAPTEGPGAWIQWTFNVQADGSTVISRPGRSDSYTGAMALRVGYVSSTSTGTPSGATQVWLYGGAGGTSVTATSLSGIYFDDITVVPEPMSLGTAGLASLLLLRRRRA